MARRKRDKKSYGRSNVATDASRRSSRRKRCRSSKKLARRLRRQKSQCSVCKIASGGKKYLFDCGHVVDRRCVKPRLKYPARACPNCREKVLVKVYPWLISPEEKLLSIEAILAEMKAPPLLPIKSPVYKRKYLDDSSSYMENRNMDLHNQSSLSGNSITDSPDPTFDLDILTRELPSTSRVLDWISELNNSGGYSIDPSSNFDPYSRNDSPSPSSNFDHSTPDSPDPTSGMDIPTREVPGPSHILDNPSSDLDNSSTDSPNPTSGMDIPTREVPGPFHILDNPSSDLDNSRVEFFLAELARDLGLNRQQWHFNSSGLPRCHESLPPHEYVLIGTDSNDDEIVVD